MQTVDVYQQNAKRVDQLMSVQIVVGINVVAGMLLILNLCVYIYHKSNIKFQLIFYFFRIAELDQTVEDLLPLYYDATVPLH
jgi:hypothetical protein